MPLTCTNDMWSEEAQDCGKCKYIYCMKRATSREIQSCQSGMKQGTSTVQNGRKKLQTCVITRCVQFLKKVWS
jgi:hypothetical protein